MEEGKPWNEKVMDSLRQTGERVRQEAEKLMSELNDPQNHERVRAGLKDLGDWAKQTAEEAAVMVDQAAQSVEAAVRRAAQSAKASKPARKRAKAARKTKAKAKKR